MNDSSTTITTAPTFDAHRRPRWATVLTTVVAACAIWFMQPHRANAGPRPSLAAAAAVAEELPAEGAPRGKQEVAGKANLNNATADQLMLLPGVGPSKAGLIVAFRGKHGPFKRVADLRKVKGFGYKTMKRLTPYLDVKGETTLALK